MLVKFYGVRGSIACAGDETRRYGGNTSCVAIVVGGETLIFDAGTGLRKLGGDLMKAHGPTGVKAHLFLSHLHWDHIQGFPFFTPAFVPKNQLNVWGVTPRPSTGDSVPDVTTPTAVNTTPASATSGYILSNQSCVTLPAPAPISARMTGASSARRSTNASSPAGV